LNGVPASRLLWKPTRILTSSKPLNNLEHRCLRIGTKKLFIYAPLNCRLKVVLDETYHLAIEEFGEATVIDLVTVLGYYNLVVMTLKTFEILPAYGSTPLTD